jgi:hypothetical protein
MDTPLPPLVIPPPLIEVHATRPVILPQRTIKTIAFFTDYLPYCLKNGLFKCIRLVR